MTKKIIAKAYIGLDPQDDTYWLNIHWKPITRLHYTWAASGYPSRNAAYVAAMKFAKKYNLRLSWT